MNKTVSNAEEAIKDIQDNMTLMLGALVYVEFQKIVLLHWCKKELKALPVFQITQVLMNLVWAYC